jgi:type I restriction enzyme S subunit
LDDTLQHVSELGIANSSARVLPAGTVCLSRTASVGYIVVMGRPMATSQDFVNWVCSDHLEKRYLKHVLLAETEALRRFAYGTTHTTIYYPEVKAFHIAYPPPREQRAIADVLDALDDKIESNRRTANAARAVLMQAPPSTGESSPLDQAAGFHNGGALTKHATGSGRPILRIKELRAGVTVDTPRTDAPVRETHEVASGDLLFSWSGTLLTTRWCGEPAVLNQHVFRVDPRPGLSRWFVEAWIERHLDTFRAIAADKATTMGHIQRHHLSEALVALPPRDEIDNLMRTYDPLDHLRMSLLTEVERLAAIRDALLPRLVSGRLRVAPTSDSDDPIETVLDLV